MRNGEPPISPDASAAAFFAGEGEVRALARELNWAATPLGPPSTWSPAMRTMVRVMFDTPFPVCLWAGPQYALVYNDSYRRILAAKHPSALGRPGAEVWAEIWDGLRPQFEQVRQGGDPVYFEDAPFVMARLDGGGTETAWFSYSLSALRDENGTVAAVLNISPETTDRVLAVRHQQQEGERLRNLFQQMPGFVAVLEGPDHVYRYVNSAFLQIAGDRDYIGRTVREKFPELASQGYYELLDNVYATGKAFSAVDMPLELSGDTPQRYIDLVYQPIKNALNEVTGIFIGGYDVTQRVKADKRRHAFVRLTDKFRALTNRADIGFAASEILGENLGVSRVGYGTIDSVAETLTVDRDWTAPGVATLAGMLNLREYGSFIDSLKNNEFIAISDVRADPRTSVAADALETRSARSFVNVPVVEHGKLVAVLYVNNARPRQWSTEDLDFIRKVAERTRTTTERLNSEQALRDSEARLREANESLERKVEARTRELYLAEDALRQSQKMDAIGQLTGGIAHDFNNLLGAISGSLELLKKRISAGRFAEVDRYIDGAHDASRRAASLTQRLLAFSRRQTLDPKPVEVNRLINGMDDLIRRSVGPNIIVEVVGAGGLWPTKVDPSQLENSLLNLCVNARDAMAASGGRLTIETANKWLDERGAKERDLAPGQYVALSVTDTGTGMDAGVISHVFEPFFTTKPIGAGTGLGLSMVYGFARQSGGQIRIYSKLGKGTTMCLYLPRFVGEAENLDQEPTRTFTVGDGETVLVIDDEATIRILVVEVLEECGYNTREAGDGLTGLKILQSDARIDLLITDVGLPGGMNGRQIADAARMLRPNLKVIFITGYAENAAIGSGHLDSGMEIITKPFVMTDLGNKVRELLLKH